MNWDDHFKKNGDHYDLTAAASFLMLALYAYDQAEPPAPGLRAKVDAILSRASAAGFGRGDIFVSMLVKGDRSTRILQLAQDVVDAIGSGAAMIDMIRDFKNGGKAGDA